MGSVYLYLYIISTNCYNNNTTALIENDTNSFAKTTTRRDVRLDFVKRYLHGLHKPSSMR